MPAPLVVTGVHGRAWRRTIRGRGECVRNPVAAGRAVGAQRPHARTGSRRHSADHRHARFAPARTHADCLRQSADPGERIHTADQAIREALVERAPTSAGLLANRVLDEMREHVHNRTGVTLAERFACSERTIQRACGNTLGHGPKWLSRRVRLQEVRLALVSRPTDDLSDIAADLGYTDQSHLARDFRSATGLVPDAYRRTVSDLASRTKTRSKTSD